MNYKFFQVLGLKSDLKQFYKLLKNKMIKGFSHKVSLVLYVIIILVTFFTLVYFGFSFYKLPVEGTLRLEHPLYNLLKPTGFIGHGLGIIGTLFIVFGLFGYMVRKRMKIFARVGLLKHWLEWHIFICTLGFIMVLFHTTFKFGGVVSIGLWSLVIVFLSGVIGRFIYIQIPRSIEGRELSVLEIQDLKSELDDKLYEKYGIRFSEVKTSRFSEIRMKLIEAKVPHKEFRKVRYLIRKENILEKRIQRLDMMHKLFNHWHVLHLPFAIIMLIIMIIHVALALYLGYSWILFK